MVPVRDAEVLGRVRPDAVALGDLLRELGIICVYLAAHDPARDTAQARSYFAADGMIVEDPATGSAAGPLCAYLHARRRRARRHRSGRGDGPAEPLSCARRASACASPATSSCSPTARSSSNATAERPRAGAPGARVSWRRRRARGVAWPSVASGSDRASPVPQHKTRCLCRWSVGRRSRDLQEPAPALDRRLNRWPLDSTPRGAIAQMGERLLCKQEVAGSIPAGSIPESLARHLKANGRLRRSSPRRRRRRLVYCPDGRAGATIAEGDEPDEPTSDNSLGRLLALSDGVFAIAMTLLALDLRLPDLGTDPSDAQLRHALGDDWHGYLAFVISFYVVANYWGVHRRAMRAVTTIDTRLISHTLPLLLWSPRCPSRPPCWPPTVTYRPRSRSTARSTSWRTLR